MKKVFTWIRTHRIFVSIVLFVIALNIIFFLISPREIVSFIGVENSYLAVFLLSLSGITAFTSGAFFAAVATFGAGGVNPLLLGLVGGIGIFISDSIFYTLAAVGRYSMPDRWQSRVERFAQWTHRVPRWVVLLVTYLYLGFSPFPNDILMVALVLSGFRYRFIVIPLFAGSLTVVTLTAHLGSVLL